MTPEVKAENAARDHNAIQRRAHSHLLQGAQKHAAGTAHQAAPAALLLSGLCKAPRFVN